MLILSARLLTFFFFSADMGSNILFRGGRASSDAACATAGLAPESANRSSFPARVG